MESLTQELYTKAKEIVEEVERQGGMTKSVITGFPKLKIEESATRRQADIDSGREVIVGVNKFRLEKEDELEVRKIDNSKVLSSQIAKLRELKATRDASKVKSSLARLEEVTAKRKRLTESLILFVFRVLAAPALICWSFPLTALATWPQSERFLMLLNAFLLVTLQRSRLWKEVLWKKSSFLLFVSNFFFFVPFLFRSLFSAVW